MGTAAAGGGGGEVVPTEDVVQALVDYLVEPILPRKSCENNPSNASLQRSLATQMHAVVLLYNYYHRKQFPQLEFLDCESFCKVAANAKPSLLVHFDQTENLSVARKAILDACNISVGLDNTKDAPSMEGWPISKIAVFLTDFTNQNCSLHFCERTEGVWSLIEKYYGECDDNLEGLLGDKNRGKSLANKWQVKLLNGDKESRLQHIAMSAVKEKTGINPTELTVLESHVAYSLTEEKTTACLFIMKSTSVDKDVFQVPIKDAIDSLRGPLVMKCGSGYIAADSVQYFHLLPYAGMITDWFSRELLANGSVPLKEVNATIKFSLGNDEPVTMQSPGSCETTDFPALETNNIKNMDHKENSDYQVNRLQNTDEDTLPTTSHQNKKRKATSTVLVDNAVKKFSTEGNLRSTKSGSTVEDDINGSVREVCNNDLNVNYTQTSMHIDASMDGPIVALASELALVVSDAGYLDCKFPCSPGDNEITGEGNGSDEVMLKEVANITFPSDNPDKPLNFSDKILLTDTTLKVLNSFPDQTSSMTRELHSCKKGGSLQLVCSRDGIGSSEPDADVCSSGVVIGSNDLKMEEDVERLGQLSAITCGVVSVGSVSFPQKYMQLYKRIVARFGDIIMPESKESTLYGDMVSTVMKGLFEVVESMLQASPGTVDVRVLDSWEMRIRFCEFAGLNVGWLRDHFERIKLTTVSSDYALVQELEGRVTSIAECLEALRKRAEDLDKELEVVRSEEKALLEQKVEVDSNLEAARLRQELFSFSLF